jgi:hypothetical protein
MAQPQLKLVIDAPAPPAAQDPTRRIFEHWLFMLGRNPRRCKLGTTRRAAINGALTVYDEETLLLTMEGIAADPLEGKPESMRAAMRELEWLLASEARIERWADKGEQLRLEAARLDARQPDQVVPDVPADPVAAAAARDRVRALATAMRGVHG